MILGRGTLCVGKQEWSSVRSLGSLAQAAGGECKPQHHLVPASATRGVYGSGICIPVAAVGSLGDQWDVVIVAAGWQVSGLKSLELYAGG